LIFKSIIVIDQERPNFLKNSRERYWHLNFQYLVYRSNENHVSKTHHA
jgi:hypothetical protein